MAAGCCLEIAKEQKNMEEKVYNYYEKIILLQRSCRDFSGKYFKKIDLSPVVSPKDTTVCDIILRDA
jgi:hypothetical protein